MLKKGFTLLEVIISFALLASIVTMLQRQQVASSLRKFIGQERIERIFLIKKEISKLYFSPPVKPKIKKSIINTVPFQITSLAFNINRKSSLKDFASGIKILSTEGEWKNDGQVRKLKLLTFVATSKEKKKE